MGSVETLNSIRNVVTIVIIMGPSKGSWHKPLMGCLKLTTPSSSPHPTGRRGQRWSLQSHLLTIPPTVPPGGQKSSWQIFPSSPQVLPRLLPRGGPPPSQGPQFLSPTSRQGSAFTIKLEAPSLGPRGPCIRPDSLSLLKSGDQRPSMQLPEATGHGAHRSVSNELLYVSLQFPGVQEKGTCVLVLSLSAPQLETSWQSILTKTVAQEGKPVPFQG